ncbi:hypothetical protein T02_5824 [Trichinella nativa]|uniref:Uncharacterized protein n=1 Tax=Trichinella nativa TaxID=6335 RepID=A0A0V1KYA2_9BILA|nr:hypothetical protein T02_5824 [Trichinella nativa]
MTIGQDVETSNSEYEASFAYYALICCETKLPGHFNSYNASHDRSAVHSYSNLKFSVRSMGNNECINTFDKCYSKPTYLFHTSKRSMLLSNIVYNALSKLTTSRAVDSEHRVVNDTISENIAV